MESVAHYVPLLVNSLFQTCTISELFVFIYTTVRRNVYKRKVWCRKSVQWRCRGIMCLETVMVIIHFAIWCGPMRITQQDVLALITISS